MMKAWSRAHAARFDRVVACLFDEESVRIYGETLDGGETRGNANAGR